MDQIKIGRFISKKRKEKNITQSFLAEMLGISDRAVSKWENGICMPDADNIIQLCKILEITVNDLFCGEAVDMNNNEKMLEENLISMAKLKQKSDKHLLVSEMFIGVLVTLIFLVCIFVASFMTLKPVYRILLICIGFVIFAVCVLYAVKIEQSAGYYECKLCGHRYVPKFSNVLFAMHINRTRYMKCPKCHRYSWNKKVISKEIEND